MTGRSLEEILRMVRGSSPLSSPEYRRLARDIEPQLGALPAVRLLLLASFTTDFLTPYLVVEGARRGLGVRVHHGGYGQFEQALLQWVPPSEPGTDVLVLMMRLEDVDPDVGFRYHAADRASFESLGSSVLERLDDCARLFRERSGGPVLVANFAVPEPRPLGVFDANDPDSLTHRVHALNRELATRMSARSGALVWDYAGLVASGGSQTWGDPRLEALARSPISAPNQPALAQHLMRSVSAATKPSSKCLVVDLDDTLWGGVIGDEGITGIQLGDDYPGSAFKRFQRAILGLRDRGILLAICSSNEEAVALEAIEGHPEMLLRGKHIAAHRINWNPKSENLRAIAEELNIGVDSLVFFDDNPVVRAEVRDRLPQVLVVEVPSDPVLYVDALASVAELDTPRLTAEDRLRAPAVQAESDRRAAERGAVSLEHFLEGLEMRAHIGSMNGATAPRVSQLVAKTNQFNLTTRRRSQAELEAMAARQGTHVEWLRLSDRYGDLGLVCVGILVVDAGCAYVDSLILSCRVANRGIEQTMLAHLVGIAREYGCTTVVGEYRATAKNRVVEGLYPKLGFFPDGGEPGAQRYRLDLANAAIESPGFVEIFREG